jgi:hypothetical protein
MTIKRVRDFLASISRDEKLDLPLIYISSFLEGGLAKRRRQGCLEKPSVSRRKQ